MTNKKEESEMFFKSTKDLVADTIRFIEKRNGEKLRGKIDIQGVPTGFIDLDKAIDGLPCGITVVGARPEDGLTDFGLNIALNASETHKILYLSPEIPSELLVKRAIGISSRTNMKDINDGFLAERDFHKITRAAGKLAFADNLNFYDGKMDSSRFLDACRYFQDKKGTQLVILDRFQSLFPKSEASINNSFYWKAMEISGVLHDLVAERGLALLLLSEVKKKGSEKICSDHLRDYGVFEYNARPIILFERARGRACYEDDAEADAKPISVNVTNNFSGDFNFEFPLIYIRAWGRFETAAKVSDDDIEIK